MSLRLIRAFHLLLAYDLHTLYFLDAMLDVLIALSGSSPGECWAFRGSQGSVVISLSSTVSVMAVSLEHIPASLAPDGSITSAPRDVQIFGLNSVDDENPVDLVSPLQPGLT